MDTTRKMHVRQEEEEKEELSEDFKEDVVHDR